MDELLGADLDAAVARALGLSHMVEQRPTNPPQNMTVWLLRDGEPDYDTGLFNPSVDGHLPLELQAQHDIAVYSGEGTPKWVAGFDLHFDELDGITVAYEGRGDTPAVAICRAIVQRHKDEQIAATQAVIKAAADEHMEMLRGVAWERAEVARRTRVPFTEFANEEEREAYRWAMDAQLDVIKHRNPDLFGGKE